MLGGSFWIAFVRNGIGGALMMLIFLLLDQPKFCLQKTIRYYAAYWLLLSVIFSFWYLADIEIYIRFAGLSALPLVGIFCTLLSADGIYLSFYKVAVSFYLLGMCVFVGVDASRLWFGGSIWADIAVRLIMCTIILSLIAKKFRRIFLDNLNYLKEEMDLFSLVALISSVMLAAFIAYWPTSHTFSVTGIIRISATMFMAGVIQYMIFHLYLHMGKEHRYQTEKQLLEMNDQFLRLQLELADETEKQAARIRHDIRHHCILIKEYVQKEDTAMLLAYLNQYIEDIESMESPQICTNKAINSILTAYSRYAKMKGIHVSIEASAAENLAVRDIDLVAVLANIFENAIHGCVDSGASEPRIIISMKQKAHKLVIRCKNTCRPDLEFNQKNAVSNGKHGQGVYSIMKTASRYHGETDFMIIDGMFEARILLHLDRSLGSVMKKLSI